MKLLVIEDEADLRLSLVQYLGKSGYLVEEAGGFAEGLRKIKSFGYEGLIVDLNLPDGDGLQLLKAIQTFQEEPIVLITSARDTIEDRLVGFEMGADDYLVKPYHLSELNARLKAITRRKIFQGSEVLTFEPLIINISDREARVHNELLDLTKKEFDLLVFLARNKNKVVTKGSLAEYIWGDYIEDAASYDFIYSHIKNLRKKLEKAGAGEMLKNIYGVGYKFRFPV